MPVANAGRDKCVVLPVSSVPLNGSGVSRGGFLISFNWTKLSGPASFHIVNPYNPVIEVELLIEGEYVFELTITGDKGISSKDIMSVLVSITDPGCGAWDCCWQQVTC